MNDNEKFEEFKKLEKIKDLEGRIKEALDLIKDDPKLEKDMDEIPRLNYLLECIRSTLEPDN